jgi:hypothetical protein
MHITIRRYHINAGQTQELVDRVRNSFMPLISQAPKFVSYYAVDEGDGDITTVSVFEDEASANASNDIASKWAMQNVSSLISMPPKIIAGEVVAMQIEQAGQGL